MPKVHIRGFQADVHSWETLQNCVHFLSCTHHEHSSKEPHLLTCTPMMHGHPLPLLTPENWVWAGISTFISPQGTEWKL